MSEALLPCQIVLREFVPDRRLSLNGRQHTHFRVVMELRDVAKTHLTGALWALAGRTKPLYDQAHVRIEFVYSSHRRRDPDGLAGLAKPLLDGLVEARILTDDDCDHIELSLAAVVEPRGRETRIWITPKEPAPPIPRPRKRRIPHGASPERH